LQTPIALYECDNTQCENPQSAGAVWLFEGRAGAGDVVLSGGHEADGTEFDGRTIRIHREDPVGSYSSRFAASAATPFFAETGSYRQLRSDERSEERVLASQ
jgi:hypothetical protein